MAQQFPSHFIFKKNESIGAAGAEEDSDFLSNCFVDTGDIRILERISDHRQIILGRTGAGKSALLARIAELHPKNVIQINPENLALAYVSNSTTINYFAEIGVNLDPFFKLLWRHVFVVEVLQKHFEERLNSKEKSFWDFLRLKFRGEAKEERTARAAIDYLESWSGKFWEETEFKVKEVTTKVEKELKEEIKAGLKLSDADISAGIYNKNLLTEEEKSELVARAQLVLSKAQIQDLSSIISLLQNVLLDKQKGYYIIIDRLDENWVEEKLRYKLIMALFLTARDFIKVENVKVIISMRKDLIDRVFKLTRESGFQEEKYESSYLRISWPKKALIEVLDKRINHLVRKQYTKESVTHKDLLPNEYCGLDITGYLCERATRPRDIIDFFNKCILAGAELSKLQNSEFSIAEGEYSKSRLRALRDEWSADYPELYEFSKILNQTPPSFKIRTFNYEKLESDCLDILTRDGEMNGPIATLAKRLIENQIAPSDFLKSVCQIFYKVGLVGLKLGSTESTTWVDENGRSVSLSEITEDTSIVIHPTYQRSLGTRVNC